MAQSKLAKVRAEASQRMASMRRNAKARGVEHAITRHVAGVVTAAAIAGAHKAGAPADVMGFPWKLGLAALLAVGEAMTKGQTQAALSGAGIATSALYTATAIRTGSLVSGDGVELG